LLWLRRCQEASKEESRQEADQVKGKHSAWYSADFVGWQIQGKAVCVPKAARVWSAIGDWSFQGQWSAIEACQPGADPSLPYQLSAGLWINRHSITQQTSLVNSACPA